MDDHLPLVKGTLDILVLKALAWGPRHGFEITTWLEERSDGGLKVQDGALYHSLVRLEASRLIAGEWGVTDNNRRARYYRLTPAGQTHLKAETAQWLQYSKAVTRILTGPRTA